MDVDYTLITLIVLLIVFVIFLCLNVFLIINNKNKKSEQEIDVNDLLLKIDTVLDNKLNNQNMASEQINNNLRESLISKLDNGNKENNELFTKLYNGLQSIDKTTNVIEKLNSSVLDLEGVLSNKQARGAFGEIQLEQIVSNYYPKNNYFMQHQLPNSSRVDCAIMLPNDIVLPIDSKFPLDSYRNIKNSNLPSEVEKSSKQFKIDVKKHIDTISSKYIIDGVTSDLAIMFIPAESVFLEINETFYDLIEYSHSKNVVIVSPSTLPTIIIMSYNMIKDEVLQQSFKKIKTTLKALIADSERFATRYSVLKQRVDQLNSAAKDCDVSAEKVIKKAKVLSDMDIED